MLENMDMERRDAILADLRASTERRRRETARLRIFFGTMIVVLFALKVSAFFRKGVFEFWDVIPFVAILGSSVGAGKLHRGLAKEAAALKEPEALALILELHDCGDAEMSRLVKDVAREGLPEVTEGDAAVLAPALPALHALARDKEKGLARIAVEALGRVGDAASVPILENLVSRKELEANAHAALGDLRLRLARRIIEAAPV